MTQIDLKRSAWLTLYYSAVFAFPLSLSEIKKRLLFAPTVSENSLKKALAELLGAGKISFKDGFYGVPGAMGERRLLAGQTSAKIVEVGKLLEIVKFIPWVKAIAISGSVAAGNAGKNDDLDLLVITSPQGLWLARPLLLLISGFFGKRRGRSGDHSDNSWCFNMFLTTDNLAVPMGSRSIYSAYEVCQALFVFDRGGVERKFLLANRWVEKVTQQFFRDKLGGSAPGGGRLAALWGLENLILAVPNFLSYFIQYFYMKSHMTREKVGLKMALFHPRDTKGLIFQKWKSLLGQKNYGK